jgi:hypothetical protein
MRPFTELLKPYVESRALRSTYFFNGRVLSGEDMRREQDASRLAAKRLGRAVGAGIAEGLLVSAPTGGASVTAPTVTVQGGLALNGDGVALELEDAVDVRLVRAPTSGNGSAAATSVAGAFADCHPPARTVYVAGSGVYLLSMVPARTKEGRTPVAGLGNESAPCAWKAWADGVAFRLAQVKLAPEVLADEDHLRNRVAYLFLRDVEDRVADPLGLAAAAAPTLDAPLGPADVPLALVHWTAEAGIRWVDPWPVRRPIVPPTPLGAWSDLDPARRAAEGAAMVMQFEDHLAAALAARPDGGFAATSTFRWLPPIGAVPLRAFGGRGVDDAKFLAGVVRRKVPAFLEGAALPALFAEALRYPPIDLSPDDAKQRESLWLYWTRENLRAVDVASHAGAAIPQAYLLFVNGHVPYRGDARYDLARFDYASYALGGLD